MDLLLRGSKILKSQSEKYVFIICSTFLESVESRILETSRRFMEKGLECEATVFSKSTGSFSDEGKQVKRK